MCRVAFLFNADENLAALVARLQVNGSNRPVTYWSSGARMFVHSRFDVTTSAFNDDVFPFRDDRYVLHYNGEVFGHGHQWYLDDEWYPSDVHYCMALIQQY